MRTASASPPGRPRRCSTSSQPAPGRWKTGSEQTRGARGGGGGERGCGGGAGGAGTLAPKRETERPGKPCRPGKNDCMSPPPEERAKPERLGGPRTSPIVDG